MMPPSRRVVFVCEHGAAKSVLAASDFNALAEARGAAFRAVARGTAPDSAIASIVAERLAPEGIDLAVAVPTALTRSDLDDALRVVTFDQPDVVSMSSREIAIDAWNDMPAVSADFDRARLAIRARVIALLSALERDEMPSSARDGA